MKMSGLVMAALWMLAGSAQAAAGDGPPVASAEDARQFRAAMLALHEQAVEAEQSVIRGDEGWLFLPGELRHLGMGRFWGDAATAVSKARNDDWADPLPVIVDFHEQLKQLGVDLIVVPVPPKAVIYAERVWPRYAAELDGEATPSPRLDAVHQRFYDELRAAGVNVLDMTDTFLAGKDEAESPLYCRTDTHWATPAMRLTAETLARAMAGQPFLQDLEPRSFEARTRTVTINGDLRQMAGDAASIEAETLPLTFVGREGDEALQPLEPDEESPILLLGDSHLLVFHAGGDMHARGAGFADHLALQSGLVPDLIGVRGSGATPARISLIRKAFRDPDWLKSKQLIVWVFTAREFTETTGWRPLPLTRP